VDGTVRICGDYKITINTASDAHAYPLPTAESLFTQLNIGEGYKLDFARGISRSTVG